MIKEITKEDLPALKLVLDSIELFPSAYLDDMIADYFNDSESQDIWFAKVDGSTVVSIAFCAPEKFTEGTYNLYAIGVQKGQQGRGIGKEMMSYLEDRLRKQEQRILIVETSGSSEMELTRQFYLKCGYSKEATIRDFWQAGEDKVIFWKKL